MIVVISGSRTLDDAQWVYDALNAELARLWSAGEMELHFRTGDARGVDAIAAAWCASMDVPYTVFRADWAAHPHAAGSLRNWTMLNGAHLLIALWEEFSPGTRNAIACAMNQQIDARVRLFPDLAPVYSAGEVIRKANKAHFALQSAGRAQNG